MNISIKAKNEIWDCSCQSFSSSFCWVFEELFMTLVLTEKFLISWNVFEWSSQCDALSSPASLSFIPALLQLLVFSLSRVLTHFREGAFALLKHSWAFVVIYSPRKRKRKGKKARRKTISSRSHSSPPFCVGGQWEGGRVWSDMAGENKMWERQSMKVCVSSHVTQKVL